MLVIAIPTMKSMGAAKNEANNAAQSAPAEKTVEKAIAEVKETYDFSNVEVEPKTWLISKHSASQISEL